MLPFHYADISNNTCNNLHTTWVCHFRTCYRQKKKNIWPSPSNMRTLLRWGRGSYACVSYLRAEIRIFRNIFFFTTAPFLPRLRAVTSFPFRAITFFLPLLFFLVSSYEVVVYTWYLEFCFPNKQHHHIYCMSFSGV